MKKNIWIINHYAELPTNGVMTRHYNFAKQLVKKGYNVSIFTSSAIHNSEFNSITDKAKFKVEKVEGIQFIHVKTENYKSNGLERIRNIIQFYVGVMRIYSNIKVKEVPEVIIASSLHPLALLAGYRISRKIKCKYIVEIRDLWPESILVYKPNLNKLIMFPFYMLEKWFYKKADNIIFTMPGGGNYIRERGWEKQVNISKVFCVSNGVDLDTFNSNKTYYCVCDEEIVDQNTFKVVFCGSVRPTYNIDFLVETAHILKKRGYDNSIKIFIYGRGPSVLDYVNLLKSDNLNNIVFKGFIEKKYIPFVLSQSDCTLLHSQEDSLSRFGHSLNKSFEYCASGKPIISTLNYAFDPIKKNHGGIVIDEYTPNCLAESIIWMYSLESEERKNMENNALEVAEAYDFRVLTEILIDAIEA